MKYFLILFVTITSCLSGAIEFSWDSTPTIDPNRGTTRLALANYAANNTAIAVYRDSGDYFAAYFNGTSWTVDPTPIMSAPFDTAVNLAIDQTSGHALLQVNAFSSAYYDGSTWTQLPDFSVPGSTIDSNGGSIAFFNGVGVIAFEATDANPNTFLYASIFDENTASWGALQQVAGVDTEFFLGQTSVTSSAVDMLTGEPLIIYYAYQTFDPTAFRLNGVRFDGVSWQSAGIVLVVPIIGSTYEIKAGGGGTWAIVRNAALQVVQATLYTGPNWPGTGTTISSGDAIGVPRIATNLNNSSAAAVWQSSTGGIESNRFDGVSWIDLETLSSSGTNPAIAINTATNHIITVWSDGGANNSAFFNGTAWVDVSPTGIIPTTPFVVFNPNGQAITTGYPQFIPLLSAVGIEQETAPEPPSDLTGRQSTNKFLTQSNFANILNWVASPTPGVVYRVRRDGVLIATTELTTYTDTQIQAGRTYLYSVTAYNGTDESAPIFVEIRP